jgi:tripartite-type tricarboxylate transporter receptor subunit TctC
MGGISKAFIRFLAQKEGVNWTQIPTRGGGEMVPFLLGDKVDFAFSGGIHQKYGDKMIVLASFLSNRLPLAPGVPSIKEIYGISMPGNAIIAVPKGTPKAIVAKLEAAIKKSMDDPDFTKILKRIKFPKRFIPSAKLTTKVDEAVAGLKKVLAVTKKK